MTSRFLRMGLLCPVLALSFAVPSGVAGASSQHAKDALEVFDTSVCATRTPSDGVAGYCAKLNGMITYFGPYGLGFPYAIGWG